MRGGGQQERTPCCDEHCKDKRGQEIFPGQAASMVLTSYRPAKEPPGRASKTDGSVADSDPICYDANREPGVHLAGGNPVISSALVNESFHRPVNGLSARRIRKPPQSAQRRRLPPPGQKSVPAPILPRSPTLSRESSRTTRSPCRRTRWYSRGSGANHRRQ